MANRRSLYPAAALFLAVTLCSCNRAKPPLPPQSASTSQQNTSTTDTQSQGVGQEQKSQYSQTDGTQAVSNTEPSRSSAQSDNTQVAYNGAPVSSPTLDNSSANVSDTANRNVSTSQVAPLVIPAGTTITVRMQQSLSSATARPGQRFEATIDQPVVAGDLVVLPVGAVVMGHVTMARRSGRLHHPGELGLTLDTVSTGHGPIRLATVGVVASGRSHKRRNLAWIGGGGGGGALLGALAAGAKGALIGSGIGVSAGTTTAFFTGKKNVAFDAERRVSFRLRYSVSVPA